MLKTLDNMQKLPGETILLVDVSYSMRDPLSQKSDLSRMDAGCALAILLAGICERLRILTLSSRVVEVPAFKGMGLGGAIVQSQPHGNTYLGVACKTAFNLAPQARLIVITDEQSHDPVPDPVNVCKSYMINVASAKNGVGYNKWVHIDGFSESVVTFIQEHEKLERPE